MQKLLLRLIVLSALVGAGYAAYRVYQQLPQRQESLPTAKVRQGDVVVRSFTRGELRAVRSVTLTAPNLFGTVQVTRLAALGAFARPGDLVVEFDDAEVLSRLEEKQLELDQIDEQVKKAEADLAIRDNQDQVELLRSRYAVRRADLEVKRNELISAIDAKKNLLTKEEAERRLRQLESDIKSRREQAQAELAVLQEKRNKATLELNRERQRLAQVKLLSPMAGLVAVKQNRSSVTMFGMQLPDIREGDQVQPGMPVVDVLDLSEMEIIAKVGELDRANLNVGQDVQLRLDAIPEKSFPGKIKSMSGTASANMFSSDPAKKFDVLFSIDMRLLLETLGTPPEKVQSILAQAERNRNKAIPGMGPGGGMAALMAQGGPMPGMANGNPGAGAPAAAQGGGNGQARRRPEGGGAGQGRREGGAARGGAANGGSPRMPSMFNIAGVMYTQKDLDNAKLPPPPDEDGEIDVLLRPGLLADVEITVEKVPNAIHVPIQAVFEKNGKSVVYVKQGNAFVAREIRPVKRSESVMIIESGAKPGEVIALADPEAKPGDKKKGEEKKGGAASALPGGKGGM